MASNVKYTHITVDAGAAAKFYRISWNNPVEFKNVLIYLGDFQGMMEFFSIIGKTIQGSGLKTLYTRQGSEHLLSSKQANIIIVLGWCMRTLQKSGCFVKITA